MLPACGPTASTQPKITSSTAAGSTPVRSIRVRSTCAPRSAGVYGGQPAAAPADRGADGVHQVSLSHPSSLPSMRLLGKLLGMERGEAEQRGEAGNVLGLGNVVRLGNVVGLGMERG